MAAVLRYAHEIQIAAEAFASGDLTARRNLLRAIRKLTHEVETPTEALTRISYQPVQNATLRIAVEMGLPQALAKKQREPVTAAELSKQTGASQDLIVRVMRVLVAINVCNEVSEEQYLANDATETLASPAFTGGTRYLYDLFIPIAGKFVDYFRESGFQSPESKSPFEYTFNKHMWPYIGKRPDLQVDMMNYMAGRRKGSMRWPDVFPIKTQLEQALSDDENSILFVDVGGNQGHDLKLFQERVPDTKGRLILMDLPEAVNKITGPMNGIEVVPYDFFTPQRIEGARYYFFRGICHDWPDKACQKFLGNTVKAMKQTFSSLLINDFVLPDMYTEADLQPALLDIMMMSMCCGIERTERQWRSLLDSVGLEVVRIWSVDGAESVIEAILKE